MTPDPHSDIKWKLSSSAMKGNWKEVINIYQKYPEAHKASIRSGDTALHMAILDGQELVVRELVKNKIIDDRNLQNKNKLGNTPLHLAAHLGHANMCSWIAKRDPKLIGIRSKDSETPIFRAVVHGRKDAFLRMHRLCEDKEQAYRYCGRTDGKTILHAAISGEHFDLALEIIHLYPKFVNRVDERGLSPLHLLASKPSVFRSGSRMRFLHSLIYPFIFVKKLPGPSQSREDDEDHAEQTSSSVIRQLRERRQGSDLFPMNYATCVGVLALIFKAMGVLGLGRLMQIGNIVDEKKKHVWSVQIMEKLLHDQYSPSLGYEYGGSPKLLSGEHDGDTETDGHDHDELAQVERDEKKDEDNGKKKVVISKKTSGVVIQVDDEDEKRKNKLEVVIQVDDEDEKRKNKLEVVIQVDDEDEKRKNKLENVRNQKRETPLLIAAKHGILEMVNRILDVVPVSIHDENTDEKNIVLLAAEYRQANVYYFLLKRQNFFTETIFYKTDKDGNSALHITAKMSDTQSWSIPGPALQMQWEIKWYQFVEKSMSPNFFVRYNKNGETAWEIFRESHADLITEAGKWLTKTSQACSVVSVLIATVAFTTCTTVPGGPNAQGAPVMEKEAPFRVFAIGSLVALCFSIASVVMFMIFFTSRYKERDFATNLPTKFLVELTCLLVSIAAVLISFCSAHFLVIRDSYKYTAFSLYVATLFPVVIYAFWQVPRYVDLMVATWRNKPHRIHQ